MKFIEPWVTGFRYYLVHIMLLIATTVAEDFNAVVVFGLTLSEVMNSIAMVFYICFLILIVVFIIKRHSTT
ncbi:hypothetical protein [Shewanella sp. W3-18-1]|uniref:hypothetical protein n=1 Tax=Shewanella sp. (strain W3-18-1) TaxID=351745 RepID=UPI0002E8A563|nr:hypothetical protein [Shewanella sp. W3-18-1]